MGFHVSLGECIGGRLAAACLESSSYDLETCNMGGRGSKKKARQRVAQGLGVLYEKGAACLGVYKERP